MGWRSMGNQRHRSRVARIGTLLAPTPVWRRVAVVAWLCRGREHAVGVWHRGQRRPPFECRSRVHATQRPRLRRSALPSFPRGRQAERSDMALVATIADRSGRRIRDPYGWYALLNALARALASGARGRPSCLSGAAYGMSNLTIRRLDLGRPRSSEHSSCRNGVIVSSVREHGGGWLVAVWSTNRRSPHPRDGGDPASYGIGPSRQGQGCGMTDRRFCGDPALGTVHSGFWPPIAG
jgi:hypothetical protein